MKPRRVLVLGEDTRIVLPIIRSLGRRGIEVHLGWCPEGQPASRSRFLHRAHELRPWQPGSMMWLEDLRSLAARLSFDLILPATESALVPLQRSRPQLEGLPVHLLSDDVFETCVDKERTHALASSIGIPVPRSTTLMGGDGWPARIAGWVYPLALKPLCSVDPVDPRAKRFVRRISSPEELERYVARMDQGEPVQVQEWFTGEGVGVEFLADQGAILFAFQHRRLHETVGYGSTYRESVALDPDLLAAVGALTAALGYTGIGMAEYRRAPDGGFVLLEINPRFWGSLSLAVRAGADFPLFLYRLLVHGQRAFPPGYRQGVRSRVMLDDCRWMWRSLTRRGPQDGAAPGYDGWVMNPSSRRQVARDLSRALLLRDHVDTFAWSDPAPALAELSRLAGTGLNAMAHRLRE